MSFRPTASRETSDAARKPRHRLPLGRSSPSHQSGSWRWSVASDHQDITGLRPFSLKDLPGGHQQAAELAASVSPSAQS